LILLQKVPMKRYSCLLLLWILVTASACASPAQEKEIVPSPTWDVGMLGKTVRDIPYCAPGEGQKLDLYFPDQSNGKFPVAVYVHGGGWTSGDKSGMSGLELAPELIRRGFLVASVNYRLAPASHFPAMIQDVKCAVRFLRARADLYNLDAQRIGVWGDSAGGHLAALMGIAGKQAGFDTGPYPDQSSQVQAVIDLYGPVDIPSMARTGQFGTLLDQVFGKNTPGDPELAKASPISYLPEKTPPFLVLHGTRDRTVPISESERLVRELKAAGNVVELVTVENAGHGFDVPGQEIRPTQDELVQQAANFFDEYLKLKQP
jgi:acetyl esterase/lipase